ncbi:MAG TPA: CotH kinase family protein, partial [Candidatus Angelobacter sp.]|nr:CotH kinase family protein [Candidatus Angelobacter sp.]
MVSKTDCLVVTRKFLAFLYVGLVCGANAAVIFPTNSTWTYFKGFSEASVPDPTAWRAVGFDDSSWPSGQAAFHYENSPGTATSYTGNTLLDDMFGGYTSIFLRKTFVVTNVADISELQFHAFSDDGFIAWINGTEIARFNMPGGDIPFDGTSSPALAEPVPEQNDTLGNPGIYLIPGTNVIAVQAFNASLAGSSDFVIDAALSSTTDTTPPTVVNLIPAAGATVQNLTTVEVDFSEDVAGVDASDLLINGSPAASVTAFAPWQYVFQFPQPATGTVQVAWAVGNGIHDLAGTPNDFTGGSWSYRLDPSAPPPGVMISEFMADNKKTIHDEDGDSSDWIELFNPTANDVNLAGWALTDDPKNLMAWRFPIVTLPTGGYLLVFASGKDRTNATAELHANFQLSTGGEFLALVDPATNIVSSFTPAYPSPQPTDVSYGRVEGAPDVTGYFTVPTPGGPNSTAGAGFSAKVEFAANGGTFTTPFPLELWTTSTNAAIHFTLDGTVPTDTSSLYAGPISITNTVQVRARSFEPGLLPGPLHSESYILLNANVINFTSNLPVIVIHTLGAGSISASVSKFANMSFYEPENGRTSLTNAPTLSTRAALRVRGSSTAGYPKQSWAVEFWDDFNNDKNASPLGLPEESDWVLYAPNNFEPVLIHNPFILDLSNQIGRYASRARFVEVYLNTAGGAVSSANYNGIYVLEEKIKTGKNRVDIDKLEPENVNPPEVTGGYMMKIDRLDPGDNGFFAAGQPIAYVDPKEQDITLPQRAPQQQYLQNYMDEFGNALFINDPVTGYPAYVDVGSWIDHHILNVMAFNVDALRLSAYFYKERNGKLFFGPIWDFDRALDSTDGRDSNPRVWRSQTQDLGTDFFNYPWWGEMFNDIDFWQKWIDRWQDLRVDKFSLTNMNALIDSLANTVRQEQPREQTRWGVTPRGGSYQAEVNLLKNWLASRVNFIDTNFLAKPVFSANGGPISPGFPLTVTGPIGATIYYTTNGVDPRSPGGGIAPTARVYGSPVTLNANARVAARAYDLNHFNLTGVNNPPLSSPWSGETVATFVAATPPLVITEIMYHPTPPPAASTNSSDDFEYVELKNIGAGALNLVGVRFTNGIDFTFTAASSITNL